MEYTERWLTNEEVFFEDGVPFICYKLVPTVDEDIRNQWSEHIRRHYISDERLEEACNELGMQKGDYLKENLIPQREENFAPTIIATDITEILISDIFQFLEGYTVPRVKQLNRSGKNNPEHGSDVIGYKFANLAEFSTNDKLVVAEVKASLSSDSYTPIIEAIHDSEKDEHRRSHTLNYYRERLKDVGNTEQASQIARFQRKVEVPYQTEYIPAAVISRASIDVFNGRKQVPLNSQNMSYIKNGKQFADIKVKRDGKVYLVYGQDLMELAYDIYRRICLC